MTALPNAELRQALADTGERRAVALAESDALMQRLVVLVRACKDAGVSVTEIAELSGVSRETIYQWTRR